jgi:hypothetical protein
LPASVALKIVRTPKITRVAGAPPELLGIVLHEGQSIPVVALGDARGQMVAREASAHLIVCVWMGEPIAIAGGDVIASGMVETEGARAVDLAAIYARIQAGGWATQWGG